MQASGLMVDLLADGELAIGRAHYLGLAIVAAHSVGVLAEAGAFLHAPAGQPADAGADQCPQRSARRAADHHAGQRADRFAGGVVMGGRQHFVGLHASGEQQAHAHQQSAQG
ncbi:hypothetical protein D3C78_1297760 [compost metagenome]